MLRRTIVGAGCALFALCLAPTAWASAVSDFKSGQDVFLSSVAVVMDGETYATSGHLIPKAAGTLDMTISGSDLGLGTSQAIHLHGMANGDIITWSFDDHFNPPVDVDGTNSVDHAFGQLTAKASLIPGIAPAQCGYKPCPRNITLSHASGTWVILEGSGALGIGWSRAVSMLYMRGLGGVPVPGLGGFHVNGPKPLCSSSTDIKVPISAFLSSAAPTGGVNVDFASANPGIKVVPHLTIQPGQVSAGFDATVKANFSGIVTLTAAAAGGFQTQNVEVHPASYCYVGGGGPHIPSLVLPDWLAGCIQCGTLIDYNPEDSGLVRVNGLSKYFNTRNNTYLDLAQQLNATSVNAVALADNGLITGVMMSTPSATPMAFKASMEGGPRTAFQLGNFTPAAITTRGVVVGYRGGSMPIAVYHDGKQLHDLNIRGAVWSQATGVSEGGFIIGYYNDGTVTRGFRYSQGRIGTLPSVGTTPAIPAAANANGLVAANLQDSRGNYTPVIIDTSNNVQRLSLPTGYVSLRANAINSFGWMLATGIASDGRTTRGFLYTPADGLTNLNQLVTATSGITVVDALRITENKEVIVRGRNSAGAEDLYVLRF